MWSPCFTTSHQQPAFIHSSCPISMRLGSRTQLRKEGVGLLIHRTGKIKSEQVGKQEAHRENGPGKRGTRISDMGVWVLSCQDVVLPFTQYCCCCCCCCLLVLTEVGWNSHTYIDSTVLCSASDKQNTMIGQLTLGRMTRLSAEGESRHWLWRGTEWIR